MFLQITTTHRPATDLGYLLGKRPGRFQTRDLAFGKAHVFYSEATEARCTANLWLDINAVELSKTRNQQFSKSFQLAQYVNDRPFTASSFMATALTKAYGSALNGNCKDRPELIKTPIPLFIKVAAVKVLGGADLLEKLFAPLGWKVSTETKPLDENFPDWGSSPYYTLCLEGTMTLQAALSHLFILLPVADNNKHYFISAKESEKLLAKGENWLPDHPLRDLIIHRYLKYKTSFAKAVLTALNPAEAEKQEAVKERKVSLHQIRLEAVAQELQASGARTVVDLGCGEGKLMKLLIPQAQFKKIVGMDVSYRSLENAKRRLYLENAAPKMLERVQLVHGSLLYKDERLEGFDAAALVEVIEHTEEDKLPIIERIVFGEAHPKTVIVTTPNKEYNVLYEGLEEGKMRHNDHRFEWTRAEFRTWAEQVAKQYNYTFEIKPIGEVDPRVGASSQMGVFRGNG